MPDRELCQAAYQEMYRAMIAKDIPALSRVLDESFVLVHMTGMRQPKAAFLKAVGNGTLNYASAEHDSMEVTVHGETAALVGKSQVRAAVFGGGWHPGHHRGSAEVRRDQIPGQWRGRVAQSGPHRGHPENGLIWHSWSGDNGALKIYNKTTTGAAIIVGGSFNTSRNIDWIAIGT